MSRAFWASTAESTNPVKMIVSLTACTCTSVLGMAVRRMAARSLTSRPLTISSRVAMRRPSLSSAKMVVCPSATPKMNILRAERTTALATCGLPMKISAASAGSWTMEDRPMPSVSLRTGRSGSIRRSEGAGTAAWLGGLGSTRLSAAAGPAPAASQHAAPSRTGPTPRATGGLTGGTPRP